MDTSILFALFLGIGLSASCGFRVFIPLLLTSLGMYFNWLPESISSNLPWMGTLPAVIAFSVATIIEIAGFYIPIVDNFLDLIATPLAIAAGTLLTSSFLQIDNEMLRWGLGLIVGGGTAGVVQSGTAFTRLLSTKTTLSTGNGLLATGENTLAFTGAIFSFVMPIFAGIIGIGILLLMFYFLKRSKASLARMKGKISN